MPTNWANYGKWRHGEQRQKYINAMSNKLDKQYTDLLKTILEHGVDKKDRTGTN